MTPATAAALYAGKGWPVCPWGQRGDKKFPLTRRGHLDATTDPATITAWWRRSPDAIPAIRLGADIGVVALDLDPEELEPDAPEPFPIWPQTPCCSSPSGGAHVLFAWPQGIELRDRKVQSGVTVKAHSIILAPGPGRAWDPVLGPDTPLAALPTWLLPPLPKHQPRAATPVRTAEGLSPYCDNALQSACVNIRQAPDGQQHAVLFREACSIAALAASGSGLPVDFARRAIIDAGGGMISFDRSRPWIARDIERTVDDGFRRGVANPRAFVGRGMRR
jgi:hypothetical protein